MPRGHKEGKDFEVFLEFRDGRKLMELEADHQDAELGKPASTNVWVECESNETFKIIIRDLSRLGGYYRQAVCADILIDGRQSDSEILDKEHKTCVISAMGTIRDGENKQRLLTFSDIDTVEYTQLAGIEPSEQGHIGSITVRLEYGDVYPTKQDYHHKVVKRLGSIWEGNVKLGLMVSGGSTQSANPRECMEYRFASSEEGPFYIFNFKYATRPVLDKRLGLGDFTPRPASSSSTRQPSSPPSTLPIYISQPNNKRFRRITPSGRSRSTTRRTSSPDAADIKLAYLQQQQVIKVRSIRA